MKHLTNLQPTATVSGRTTGAVATHQQRRGSMNLDQSIESRSLAAILGIQHQRLMTYLDSNQNLANLRLSYKPILTQDRDWFRTGNLVFLSTQAASKIASWIVQKQIRRELRLHLQVSGKKSNCFNFSHSKELSQ